MSKKVIYCNECDVEFTVSFGMNHEAYKPKYCVFCSYTITEDDEDEQYDEKIEEDEY